MRIQDYRNSPTAYLTSENMKLDILLILQKLKSKQNGKVIFLSGFSNMNLSEVS